MALANTVWLDDVPSSAAVQDWLAALYRNTDSKDSDAARNIADLFTDDAVMISPAGQANGRADILKSRESAWHVIDRRRHEVCNVYITHRDYSDVLIIGKLTVGFKNGKEVVSEFISRFVFTEVAGELKGTLAKVWVDTAAIKAAMKPE